MMISSPGASDPYAAAAVLDRQLRSSGNGSDDSSSGSTPLESGPDVVVTLGKGPSSSPSTYDASGKMAGPPTLEDMGADAPDSLAQATESHGDDDASSDATSASSASSAPDDASDNASVDEDAAVAA